ncbi:MAG: hypothetical protein WC685_13270 [Methylobacter sp.]|jgi:hypothetical protein
MPAAAPAVLRLSFATQQGVAHIIPMTRRDFGKPAFSLRTKRCVKTHALSLLGTTRLLSRSDRLPGMFIQKTIWQCRYSKMNQLIHAIMYTASFASMLFWIWVPGDLLLFNLLLLQLPCILLTKTTFHGLIAGNMVDIKPIKLKKD